MKTIELSDDQIFGVARKIPAGEGRNSYLDQACGVDTEDRNRIDALLASYRDGDRFLENEAIELHETSVDVKGAELAGSQQEDCFQQIGTYKLLEVIGEGGMGTVYMAEQTEPVKRRVALKLIKTGMDTRQVIARFEAERQALAMMDHPNIAKVLDAGSTESGRPYFVMELVKGIPITQFCDGQKLDVEARLKLFQHVCAAVQHAHQKGIIHRDLKPSNVLVAMYDDQPVPKVIDFGVAKAVADKLTEQTMFTRFGQIVGTLEYMSPEQAQFNNLDIDTRSDIYSLGAILCELLTGEPPFDRERVRKQALDETLRMIREEEPTRPSTKLSGIANLANVATNRRSTTDKLGSFLRGDLDWIVMKSLAKDRTRRYESAASLAADTGNHLDRKGVIAHPPSAFYRMRVYVRRHKSFVTAASLVCLSLVLGLVGTTAGFFRANSNFRSAQIQRDLARTSEKEAETRARELEAQAAELKRRTDELRQITRFQESILNQIDVTKAGQKLVEIIEGQVANAFKEADSFEHTNPPKIEDLSNLLKLVNATDAARDLIDSTILQPAISAIEDRFPDQPAVDAQLRETIARQYFFLGINSAGLELQKKALEKFQEAYGDQHIETMNAYHNVGVQLNQNSRIAEAEEYFRKSLRLKKQHLNSNARDTLRTINALGLVCKSRGKLEESERLLREAIAIQRTWLKDGNSDVLNSMINLGSLLSELGKPNAAAIVTKEAIDISNHLGQPVHRTKIQLLLNLGIYLSEQGRFAEAEPYFLESEKNFPNEFGVEHQTTATMLNAFADFLERQEKLSEAETYLRRSLQINRTIRPNSPGELDAVLELARILWKQNEFAEAERLFSEHYEKAPATYGPDHSSRLLSIANIAAFLASSGKLQEAEKYQREEYLEKKRVLGPDNIETLASAKNLATLLTSLGKLSEAEEYVRISLDWKINNLGETDHSTLDSLSLLGWLLVSQNKLRQADSVVRKYYAIQIEENPDSIAAAIATYRLAVLFEKQGKFADSLQLLEKLEERSDKIFTPDNAWQYGAFLVTSGRALTGLKKFDDAKDALSEARQYLNQGEPSRKINLSRWLVDQIECIQAFSRLYVAWHKAEPTAVNEALLEKWQEDMNALRKRIAETHARYLLQLLGE